MQIRTSLFDGLSADDVADLVSRLEHRSYPAGAILVREGDPPHDLYLIQSGSAQILSSEHSGLEQHARWIGPGAVIGETSLLTGQPAAATVKAASELDVLVMGEAVFAQASAEYPVMHRNIGRLLTARLSRAAPAARKAPHRTTLLLDCGAPPLLGYSLACSLAWHTRRPTVFLAVSDAHPDQVQSLLGGMAGSVPTGPKFETDALVGWGGPGAPDATAGGAHLMLARPADIFSSQALPGMLGDLGTVYYDIVVQVPQETGKALASAMSLPSLRLTGSHSREPDAGELVYRYTLRARAQAEGLGSPMPCPGGEVSVPALTSADEQALKRGVLPAVTPAGKTLGWVARDIAGLKVGLALGAGSEKGYAHLGVLRVLQRVGVQPDFAAGTSIGSGVAALLALGRSLDEIREVVDRVGSATFRPTLPTASFLSNAGLRNGLKAAYGEVRFEELLIPLAVIAADLVSGREVVFEQGLLWPALLASMSIPGVFPAVVMGNYALVDGGIMNPVPSNVVAGLGADVVIAVKLATPAAIPVLGAPAVEGKGRPPSFFQAIPRSIEMMQSKIFSEAASAATILIEPLFTSTSTVGWGLRRFTGGRSYEALGEQAAEAALSRIAGALPWVER